MIDTITLKKTIKYSKTLTVLYVEDNIEARESTLLMLDNLFDNIVVAVDGLEGLKLYKKQYENTNKYFDIVISDIEMPNLDGISMVKDIYSINKNQIVLMISAYTDKKYLVPLLNMGVSGFINKPLDFNAINKVIVDTCSLFKKNSIIDLGDGYTYNANSNTIITNNETINLNKNEQILLELFLDNSNKSFSLISIFEHIYHDDPLKEYSADSIRSLIKRFRKKLPENFITHVPTIGYKINLP